MAKARSEQPRQRWQLLFSRTDPLLRMRQQQVMEEWERVLREAGLPLSMSNAQRPRPRLQLAANLPMGVELRGEILEAHFDELVPIDRIEAAAALLPEGLALVGPPGADHALLDAVPAVAAPPSTASGAART